MDLSKVTTNSSTRRSAQELLPNIRHTSPVIDSVGFHLAQGISPQWSPYLGYPNSVSTGLYAPPPGYIPHATGSSPALPRSNIDVVYELHRRNIAFQRYVYLCWYVNETAQYQHRLNAAAQSAPRFNQGSVQSHQGSVQSIVPLNDPVDCDPEHLSRLSVEDQDTDSDTDRDTTQSKAPENSRDASLLNRVMFSRIRDPPIYAPAEPITGTQVSGSARGDRPNPSDASGDTRESGEDHITTMSSSPEQFPERSEAAVWGDEDGPLLHCRTCKQSFINKAQIVEHLRVRQQTEYDKHERTCTKDSPYRYAYCHKSFNYSSCLKRHGNTHPGQKPFKCSFPGCTSACYTSSNLKQHERTHTGEKPYTCSWSNCGMAFSQSSSLRKHERIHTGEKPYTCSWSNCGRAFRQSSSLKQHERTHTGLKPYTCSWSNCRKAFRHSTSLKQHERTHTGEKPYTCSWSNCGMAFSQSSSLKAHERIHTGEKPYQCSVCAKDFRQSHHLKAHEENVHSKEMPSIYTLH